MDVLKRLLFHRPIKYVFENIEIENIFCTCLAYYTKNCFINCHILCVSSNEKIKHYQIISCQELFFIGTFFLEHIVLLA